MAFQYVTFCSVDELPTNTREVFDLETMSIVLMNVDGSYYAIKNVCSHEDFELHDGAIIESCTIECPKHGAHFDLKTGEALSAPAFSPIKVFPVRIQEGEVQVGLELPD